MDRKELGFEVVDWVHWLRIGSSGRFLRTIMNLGAPLNARN
jgi:hypothetical protein